MSMDDDLKDIFNSDQINAAMGAVAKIIGGYYKELVANGLTPEQAVLLAQSMQASLFMMAAKKQGGAPS